jgi:hypothetical protein
VSEMSSADTVLPKAGPWRVGRLLWEWAMLSGAGPLTEKDLESCGGIALSKAVSRRK